MRKPLSVVISGHNTSGWRYDLAIKWVRLKLKFAKHPDCGCAISRLTGKCLVGWSACAHHSWPEE